MKKKLYNSLTLDYGIHDEGGRVRVVGEGGMLQVCFSSESAARSVPSSLGAAVPQMVDVPYAEVSPPSASMRLLIQSCVIFSPSASLMDCHRNAQPHRPKSVRQSSHSHASSPLYTSRMTFPTHDASRVSWENTLQPSIRRASRTRDAWTHGPLIIVRQPPCVCARSPLGLRAAHDGSVRL